MNLTDYRRMPAKGTTTMAMKKSMPAMPMMRKAPPVPPVPKGMKPLLAQDRKLDAKLGKFDNDADERKRRRGGR